MTVIFGTSVTVLFRTHVTVLFGSHERVPFETHMTVSFWTHMTVLFGTHVISLPRKPFSGQEFLGGKNLAWDYFLRKNRKKIPCYSVHDNSKVR